MVGIAYKKDEVELPKMNLEIGYTYERFFIVFVFDKIRANFYCTTLENKL